MAFSRPRGKGVTSIALSAIRLDELLDVYRERVWICVWQEKRFYVFFFAKNFRNAPWEVVTMDVSDNS